jgi:hypothetical protein
MAGTFRSKKYSIALLSLIFIINPFFACISSIAMLKNSNLNVKLLYFFIAIFIGLLAFTQYSPNGDISRTYHIINSISDFSIANFFIYLVTDRYIIYTAVNFLITKIVGNVQYTSLFWGFLMYYICFLTILNLEKYFENKNEKKRFVLLSVVFCFVIFVETMEVMKQAVATSIMFYSFSYYLLDKRLKCIVAFILSLGVHFSPLFMLPLFLIKKMNSAFIYIMLLLSFLLRNINLMEISTQVLNWVGLFPSVASVADSYTEQNFNNFFSNAPYFQFTFGFLCSIVLLNRILVSRSSDIIDKTCLIFIIVLNLNYSNNHNFTRLLLFSFPIYIMIYMNILYRLKNSITKKVLILFILSITFFLQFWFSFGRLGTDPLKYQTSFMNNSIVEIVISPLYSYLNYKVPVD